MPCHSDYSTIQVSGPMGSILDEHRKEIDRLTRLLCEATGLVYQAVDTIENEFGNNQGIEMSEELEAWTNNHAELDTKEGR